IARAHATQALSLPTRHELMIGKDNVPSLLLTKSAEASHRLDSSLRQADAAFPALKGEELPLFDHMAIFYQEGGKFNLDSLHYADELKRAYDDARRTDEAILNPLRFLKKTQPRDAGPTAAAPANSQVNAVPKS